jgi:hypothetical protein
MNAPDPHTRPASELEPQFRRIRAKIVRGLVQLAGAEPVRAVTGPGNAPGLSVEERRELLRRTLGDLKEALSRLGLEIAKVPRQVPDAVAREALVDTGEDAEATVERLLGELDAADGTRLERIPEEAREPISRLINEWCPVPKIFVAVHGIGDQFQNETVQNVAFQVCEYVGEPAALPLGRFHGPGATVTGTFLPDPDRDPPMDCGFAEIYWANVPRVPAADQHILEEPKKWARTLVARLRLRDPHKPAPARRLGHDPLTTPDPAAAKKQAAWWKKARDDDERIEQLLEEMIQGVIVADRLVFLADKAGLFKFNLKKLLNDYLNDVQVVTEFEDYREQLLAIFDEVLEKIHRYFYKSEIYIVAHSEGTVVSFMGLLKGLSERAKWATMVHGLMTIGSPLNKHVRFWPELFDQFEARQADPRLAPIPWKNYFDYGDPIGFNLQPTRHWMAESGWARFFVFREEKNLDDIGFTRYYFPGAAHNDYWRDPAVFGHFIQTVVDPPREGKAPPVLPPARQEPYGVPGTNGIAWVTSYLLPYVLASGLLFLACYILYKAARACIDPVGARVETPGQILFNVLGLCGVIAATSFLARIPILTKRPDWRVGALVLAALASLDYLYAMSRANQGSIERFLIESWGPHPLLDRYNQGLLVALVGGLLLQWLARGLRPVLRTLLPVLLCVLVLRVAGPSLSGALPRLPEPFLWRSLGVIFVAWSIGLMAWYVCWRYPSVGTKPLVHTGGLLILLVIASQVADHPKPPSAEAAGRGERVAGEIPRVPSEPGKTWREPKEAPHDVPRTAAEAVNRTVPADPTRVQGPIWPLFLAGAAFLYIWWLAIVLFDLTFVWHLYIRHSGAQKYIEARLKEADGPNAARAQPARGDPRG